MDIYIVYGDTNHSFSFAYTNSYMLPENIGQDAIQTIGELKAKATRELNFEPGVILVDEFNNILLDELDILSTLYPFYQLQVKDILPVIKAILPYGWDGKKFVSQGAAMQKLFENENAGLKQVYKEKKEILIQNAKPETEESNQTD